MTMLRYRARIALVAMLATAGALTALFNPAAASAASMMKIAHVVPPGDPRDIAANQVADIMKQSTSCDMRAQVYPSGQLGGSTDLIEGMQLGTIEAVVLPGSFLVGFQPIMGLMDFPYFWPRDLDKLLKVQSSDAVRKMLDSTSEKGVYSMAIWHTGYKQWTANKPLRTPADYKGVRARVMPSKILVAQQKALGMTPVTMPFPETYNALQSGAISAQENPISTTYVMKFYEVQKDLMMTNHGNLDQVFMVSKRWYDGLSDDCQADLTKAVEKGSKTVVEKTEELEKTGLASMKQAGVDVIDLDEDQIAALRKDALPAAKKAYLDETGDQGQAVLSAVSAEISRD